MRDQAVENGEAGHAVGDDEGTDLSRDGQPAQPDAEYQLQDQRQQEGRHRHADERRHAREVIEHRIGADGGEHAHRDAEQDGQQRGHHRQFDGRRQAIEDFTQHRTSRLHGLAHVAVREPRYIRIELHRCRLIEVELGAQRRDLFLGGAGSEQRHGRVAGNEARQREDDHQHQDQHRDERQQAIEQVTDHAGRAALVATAMRGTQISARWAGLMS